MSRRAQDVRVIVDHLTGLLPEMALAAGIVHQVAQLAGMAALAWFLWQWNFDRLAGGLSRTRIRHRRKSAAGPRPAS
ncbi:MAG TPA: hypothetical protein VFW64_03095 [Pseudonocardiaceae bacterium]|nr:hypothetical protein [Pseudonocardiaceae bacterium]